MEMMHPTSIPAFDDELRSRLGRRFGPAIARWLDVLPDALHVIGERWGVEWGSVIQRGTVSVVIRCRDAEGRAAVLKASPDRQRLIREAAALSNFTTRHVPAVLAVDERSGVLMIEAIEPGTALDESLGYPSMDRVSSLLNSLHEAAPVAAYPTVADRVAYLFDSAAKTYSRRPDLASLVPHELHDRSRESALKLAVGLSPTILPHGDLTPVNILEGGSDRGLVAIDPAPCLGDPAFDAIDLVLWRAQDVNAFSTRAAQLAPAIGTDTERLLDWCSAFAGMCALEVAEFESTSDERLAPLLALTDRV
jgi:streptomycin 6-kinase